MRKGKKKKLRMKITIVVDSLGHRQAKRIEKEREKKTDDEEKDVTF